MSEVSITDLIKDARGWISGLNVDTPTGRELIAELADALENSKTTLDYDRDYINGLEAKIVALEAVTESDPRRVDVIDPEDGTRYYGMIPITGGDVVEPDDLDDVLFDEFQLGLGMTGREVEAIKELVEKHVAQAVRLPVPVECNEFNSQVLAERQRQIAKGYNEAHDDKHGVDHLIMWAQEYARVGAAVKSAALLEAARECLLRKHLAVPVEPEKHAGMENARILGHWLFENYPSSEPDIAVVALAVLKSLSAVPVEPETPERFPESPHVEAKYWAELVRARRRIAELEAQVTEGTQ